VGGEAMPRSKERAPHFPKVTIAGMPDWWTLLHRGWKLENIPAIEELEQQRIDQETATVTDARLDILADHLSIPRGEWKALAKAIALNFVKTFPVKTTSVASRGRPAKPERFAIVAMVELCMLAKGISVEAATDLLVKNPEVKTTGLADALETKYYKCRRELSKHRAALTRLNMMRDHLPAMLSDSDYGARIVDDLSRMEKEFFPARVKK
jgi:hypothetical protein